jgi:signal transduction histidine kinase
VYHKSILSFITLILVLASHPSQGQADVVSKADSLKMIFPGASGKDRYTIAYKIAYELFEVDNHQALPWGERAYEFAKERGDSLEITRAGRLSGQLLRRVDKLDDAIERFHEVLPIAERNKFIGEEKRILNALALAYSFNALYDRALKYNFMSLEVRETEGNKKEISSALLNIGLTYYKMGSFEQALDYYLRCLDLKNMIGDREAMDQLYINLSLCYTNLQEVDNAKRYAYLAFNECGDDCNDNITIQSHFCLGLAYYRTNDYDSAESHFDKSYDAAVEANDIQFTAENALYLGTIALERQSPEQARVMLAKAEQFASASGYNQLLIHTYSRLARLYTETNDAKHATEYQRKYIHLKDSIYGERMIRNLTRVQTDYEERENIKTIQEKNQILQLNGEIIKRQRQLYFFLGLVAALSLFGIYMFLRYTRALNRAKRQLSIMNQSLEGKVEDRTRALKNVNNELDNFIYKTSHDIRGPLASLKGIANVALLELTDPKAQDYLTKLDSSANKLNYILTRLLIVNQINHAVLDPQEINFRELIEEVMVLEQKKGIPPRLTIVRQIDDDVLLVTDRKLLRIILENLVNNSIKYSVVSDRIEPFVSIRVDFVPNGVSIKVIDNGIGIQERNPQKLFQMFFRASERSESGGIGLYLTKLAAERLQAKVEYSVTVERYTQFSVTLPPDLSSILLARTTSEAAG